MYLAAGYCIVTMCQSINKDFTHCLFGILWHLNTSEACLLPSLLCVVPYEVEAVQELGYQGSFVFPVIKGIHNL